MKIPAHDVGMMVASGAGVSIDAAAYEVTELVSIVSEARDLRQTIVIRNAMRLTQTDRMKLVSKRKCRILMEL